MRFGAGFIVVCLILFSSLGTVVWAKDQAWDLSFDAAAKRFILKEPIWSSLTVTNESDSALPTRGFPDRFFLDGSERACRYDHAPVVDTVIDLPSGTVSDATHVPPVLEPPGTVHVVTVDLGKKCNLVCRGEIVVGEHTICYRDDYSKDLVSNETCVSFEITMPQGIDKKAYEDLGHDPLGNSERWDELLRRFPSSTYAAYVIWERWAKGSGIPWKNDDSRESFLSYLEYDPSFEYLTWKLPCDADTTPDAKAKTRFMMPLAAQCRDAWLEIALEHHPDIWFADEMRLRLATDAYLLGDKRACASKLDALAEDAKPYIAEKALSLLEAMQAKKMLPAAQERSGQSEGERDK